jgi:hypothetical protein
VPIKSRVTNRDLENGNKRINLSISLSEYDDLLYISKSMANIHPTTVAHIFLADAIKAKCIELRKAGYDPRQINIFDVKRKGRKK